MNDIYPIGVDTDGNGIWSDGETEWNSGTPLTPDELDEVKSKQKTI